MHASTPRRAHARVLPACRDDVGDRLPRIACHDAMGASKRLCIGVQTLLHNASCAQLSRLPYLVRVIEEIGLAGDRRVNALYGRAAKYMLPWGTSRAGLWQDPFQISSALLHVGGRLVAQHPTGHLFRYVEVGVFTAWTSCIIAAFITRVGGGAPFVGSAVDVHQTNIASSTMRLLHKLNVSFVPRSRLDSQIRAAQATGENGVRYDLCFIDGDHQYFAVRNDFGMMARWCGAAMFHDIQDTSTMLNANYSGGVPLFWAHAREHIRKERTTELTMQIGAAWPVFGIGIIWPGERGTAETDDGTTPETWRAWLGRGPEALWHELCRKSQAGLSAGSQLVCSLSTASDLSILIAATKRHPSKAELQYISSIPWNATRSKRKAYKVGLEIVSSNAEISTAENDASNLILSSPLGS
ncbi:hypothetical protein AB1Y20_016894 [Prymnesium parvum]|uniref:Class I SAM-dependent methyltransferase n=1 Tax=Prymnesium parvum TaxID=97485 RepID=A0AB34IDD5_PRYPA